MSGVESKTRSECKGGWQRTVNPVCSEGMEAPCSLNIGNASLAGVASGLIRLFRFCRVGGPFNRQRPAGVFSLALAGFSFGSQVSDR